MLAVTLLSAGWFNIFPLQNVLAPPTNHSYQMRNKEYAKSLFSGTKLNKGFAFLLKSIRKIVLLTKMNEKFKNLKNYQSVLSQTPF